MICTVGSESLQWIRTANDLATVAIERRSVAGMLCPEFHRGDDPEAAELKGRLDGLTRHMEGILTALREIEEDTDHAIGSYRLCQTRLSNEALCALAILAAAAANDQLRYHLHSVGSLTSLVSVSDVESAMVTRMAFSSEGVLRRHVVFSEAPALHECANPTLTENAFRRLVGLDEDIAFQVVDRGTGPIRNTPSWP